MITLTNSTNNLFYVGILKLNNKFKADTESQLDYLQIFSEDRKEIWPGQMWTLTFKENKFMREDRLWLTNGNAIKHLAPEEENKYLALMEFFDLLPNKLKKTTGSNYIRQIT